MKIFLLLPQASAVLLETSVNGIAYLHLEGELDTLSSKDFQAEVDGFLEGVTNLTLDMEGLNYITSAGLRVLLIIQKAMNEQGTTRVLNVGENVMEVLEVTGFTEILNIE